MSTETVVHSQLPQRGYWEHAEVELQTCIRYSLYRRVA